MSSWFDAGLSTLSSLTQNVTETVQNAIPKEHQELLAKLTLNTDEMKAERQQFGDEAQRKDEAKQRLGQLLPWETKDAEREILVDECKEAILELSKHNDTFFGPHEMPMLNVHLEDDGEDEDGEEDENGENDGGNDNGEEVDHTTAEISEEEEEVEKTSTHALAVASQHFRPSPESQEKLAKLQPLPPLLDEFDLDSHVGLIQRLLKEDPELVQKQASLSGGGARERVFWQNYFFHCAYTRYEAGLSIDEIWSYQETGSVEDFATAAIGAANDGEVEDEEVVFDGSTSAAGVSSGETEVAFHDDSVGANQAASTLAAATATADSNEVERVQSTNDFELVDEADGDDVVGDPELDELEAEIARELEDM